MENKKSKSKPMMITEKVYLRLEELRKQLSKLDLEDGGTGRVSYTETINYLLDTYYDDEFVDGNLNNDILDNNFDW